MASITNLEELEIWQLARKYAKEINELLATEPFRYEFGLKQQMKNASGSIMDNIAEGFGRGSKNEFINYLSFGKGSAEETRSQLFRCYDFGLIQKEKHTELTNQVEIIVRKIAALMHYLNNVDIKGQKFKNRL